MRIFTHTSRYAFFVTHCIRPLRTSVTQNLLLILYVGRYTVTPLRILYLTNINHHFLARAVPQTLLGNFWCLSHSHPIDTSQKLCRKVTITEDLEVMWFSKYTALFITNEISLTITLKGQILVTPLPISSSSSSHLFQTISIVTVRVYNI